MCSSHAALGLMTPVEYDQHQPPRVLRYDPCPECGAADGIVAPPWTSFYPVGRVGIVMVDAFKQVQPAFWYGKITTDIVPTTCRVCGWIEACDAD